MKRHIHSPQRIIAYFVALFLGVGSAFADSDYDFSSVCSSGQTLYYYIIDATNYQVEMTSPGSSTWDPSGNIILPGSVTYNGNTYTVSRIGHHTFYECTGLTGSLTIPNSVTEIGDWAFCGCTGLTGLSLGNSLTTIGEAAFYECTGLTGPLTIPNSMTTISEWAFGECGFMGSLTIPNSVTTLGESAFCYCSGFNGSLTIGNSVTAIGESAFKGCSGFAGSLAIPNSVTAIGESAFEGCDGFTGALTIPNSVTTLGESAFCYCSGFNGSLTIGNSVTSIGDYAFCNCTGFTGSLVIPNSVTEIGYRAFDGCLGFKGLNLGNSVTTIGDWAFIDCSGFTGSLTIPNSVTSIGSKAFLWCGFTGSLIIGSSVSTIGDQAFQDCYYLSSITVLPEVPPTLGENVFQDVPTDIPVYVPCTSLEDYQEASGWSGFTNMQCLKTLTVYEGTATNNRIPAYIYNFDNYTRSQFVIPADDLAEMIGTPISSMTFYTTGSGVPYTTVSSAEVYLMEVDYTTMYVFEPKASATTVYSGYFDIESAGDGGEMTIYFSTPYTYQGGNLLVGIENTENPGYKDIQFKGQAVYGASISGSSESNIGTINAVQQNFIPKTTFGFQPTCAARSLPYTYGFEEEDEFDCWTMLNCDPSTGRNTASNAHQGEHDFLFHFNSNPPQYLVSPELDCPTGVNMSFYYRNVANTWPETFQVGYSTTTKSPTAFTWGDEVTAANQNTWMLYEDSFPEGTKYVAVKYTSNNQLSLILDDFSFEPASQTQTFSLAAGWNWVSFNVEITLDDVKAAVMAANPGATPVIKSKGNGQTSFNGAIWVGALKTLDLSQMYEIKVANACTVTLEGIPVNPADHPATIKNGVNWIAYPLDETMSVATAFAGFPATGDNVKSKDGGQATWNGVMWLGALKNLTPGVGYLYISKASGDKTLTF